MLPLHETDKKLEEWIASGQEAHIRRVRGSLLDKCLERAVQANNPALISKTLSYIQKPLRGTREYALQLLGHQDSMVVFESIRALTRWDHHESLNSIWKCRTHGDFIVRQAVTEAAWGLSDTSHRCELEEMLCDRSPLVRMWAVLAYNQLHPSRIPDLYEILLRKERYISVRAAFYCGLYLSGHREYLYKMVDLLNNCRASNREVVARMLETDCRLELRDAEFACKRLWSRFRVERNPDVQRVLLEAFHNISDKIQSESDWKSSVRV